MKYCTKCQQQLQNEASFCTNCGKKQVSVLSPKEDSPLQRSTNQSTVQTKQTDAPRKKSPASKGVMVAVILLGIGYGTHQLLSTMYTSDAIIDEWETAVLTENISEVQALVEEDEAIDSISKEETAAFVDYLNNETIEQLFDELRDAATEERNIHRVKDTHGNDVLQLHKGNKRFGIYDQYQLSPVLFSAEISSSREGLVLTVGGEEYVMEDKDEPITVDGLLAGEHVLDIHSSQNEELAEEKVLSLAQSSANHLSKELRLNWEPVEVEADFPEAELILDGENTGVLVEEADDLGLFAKGETLHISAKHELEGQEFYTDELEYTVGEANSVLNFDTEEIEALNVNNVEEEEEDHVAGAEDPEQLGVETTSEEDLDRSEPYVQIDDELPERFEGEYVADDTYSLDTKLQVIYEIEGGYDDQFSEAGGVTTRFGNFDYGVPDSSNIWEGRVVSITGYPDEVFYVEDVKQVMGEPDTEKNSHQTGDWMLIYHVNSNVAAFEFAENENGELLEVRLRDES
ncbi:TcaA second domain-containing protein [Salsuginibacillus kocurii]|uniref:TcaA second domain-containing protein n=1 Tax=Salsuginibacillus kocurii TaxID=427078 RepID=UPI0003829F73|nr:zinc ribbon domain-containing protein [Salsuginibacillus kocurii]